MSLAELKLIQWRIFAAFLTVLFLTCQHERPHKHELHVFFLPPPAEELPLTLTCGGRGLAGDISNVQCLPCSVSFVAASVLRAPSGTAPERKCRRAWIDCNALMDLCDIYEPDVGCRPSHGAVDAGSHSWYDFSKAFLVFFHVTSVFGITASLNFTAPVDE